MKVTLVVLFALFQLATGFIIPFVLIEIFVKHVYVSILDKPGIQLFAFHAKIGSPFNKGEAPAISRNVTKPYQGRWIFSLDNMSLKTNDIIYYWVDVDHSDGNETKTYSTRGKNSSCTVSTTEIGIHKNCRGQLLWMDDFNFFDSPFWIPEYKFAGKPDYEFVEYNDRRMDISGGFLKIQAIPLEDNYVTGEEEMDLGVRCTGVLGTSDCVQKADAFLIRPPVASAQISTKTTWAFKYGRIDIRAKLPKGDWVYPQLYLNPANEVYGPDYSSGQIRIAFVQGNSDMNHILQGGAILGDSQAGRHYLMKTSRRNSAWSDGFHTFSVLWEPGFIALAVDDERFNIIYPPEEGFVHLAPYLNLGNVEFWRRGSKLAPFDKIMNLVIGVGVGGHNFEDRTDGTKPWKNYDPKAQKKFYEAKAKWTQTWTNASLYVDYIKMWTV